jgi:hypothetical protein
LESDNRLITLRRAGSSGALVQTLGGLRKPVDHALDQLRFWLDRNPLRSYQPVPVLGVNHAARDSGTQSRWEVMRPLILRGGVQSAVDVGCDAGWFTLQLASEGIRTIGVEYDPPAYRTATVAARRSGLDNVGVLVMRVEPESVVLLPEVDCSLLLAVWHHVVREQGFNEATLVLRAVWERTNKVLFFETGESEMDASYSLPVMHSDAQSWITQYLGEHCEGGVIKHLGTHDAFTPDHRPCRRNLFAVTRPAVGLTD